MLSIAKGWALSVLTVDLKCLLLPQGMIQSLKHISMKLEVAGVTAEVASESPFTSWVAGAGGLQLDLKKTHHCTALSSAPSTHSTQILASSTQEAPLQRGWLPHARLWQLP